MRELGSGNANGSSAYSGEQGLRGVLRALDRRKWTALAAFVVTALGLWAAFVLRYSYQTVCLVAVKKPSQMFGSLAQGEAASGASVSLLEGQTYKEMVESMGFAAKVAKDLARVGPRLSREDVMARLRADFKDPDLLRLKVRDADAATAVSLANTACETLAELNQKELRTELEATVESLTRLLGEAGAMVAEAQTALARYTVKQGLASVDFNSSSPELLRSMQQLAEQEIARANHEAALQAAEDRLRELTIQRQAPATVTEFTVEPPAVTTLRAQIEAVRVKLSEARKQFTDAHPNVTNLRGEIETLQRELDDHVREARGRITALPAEHELAIRQKIVETRQEVLNRKAQVAAWTRLIQEQRQRLNPVPTQRTEVEPLKRALLFAEDRYRTLLRRLDEARVSLEATRGTLSIVQPSVGPEPENLRLKLALAVALLLAVPIGVALVVDYTDRTVRSPLAFSRWAGVPCLATVPKERGLRSGRALRRLGSKNHIETFHVLRSGLRFASVGLDLRKVAIIGTKHGEGRSTLVLHLARALGDEGRQVVMVDADLRSPTASGLARMLGIESTAGLVEVVTGEAGVVNKVLRRTRLDGVVLLPAKADGETIPPNAEVLFRSPRFERVLEELDRLGDIVLFDTSPILDFPDTLELLPHMDGVIFVAESGRATDENIQRSLDLVRAFGIKRLLGVVLNKVPKGS